MLFWKIKKKKQEKASLPRNLIRTKLYEKIWQVNGLRGGENVWQCFSLFFIKRISPWFNQVAFTVWIPEVTLKWLWTFRLSIISISCIWAESSGRRFLSAALIKNSKLYQSVTTTSTSLQPALHIKKAWEELSRNLISYIRKSFELAVINIYCNIAMKSVPVAPRSGFPIKMVASIF